MRTAITDACITVGFFVLAFIALNLGISLGRLVWSAMGMPN